MIRKKLIEVLLAAISKASAQAVIFAQMAARFPFPKPNSTQ